ncbi:FHIPEP family type III secretion protein [Amycolatopsis sp. NPDC004747]
MTNAEAHGQHQETEAALANGRARLRELTPLSTGGQALVKAALKLLKGRDPGNPLDSIDCLRADLRQVDAVLRQVYELGLASEDREANRRPFEQAWIAALRRRLATGSDTMAWRTGWLTAWSEALAALRFDTADVVADFDHPEQDIPAFRSRLRSLTHHLASTEWHDAIESVDGILATGAVPVALDTRLRVLKARLLRRRLDDLNGASAVAEEVARRADNAPPEFRDLALAALVEVHIAREHLQDAHQLTEDLLDREVGSPDLFVAAGRLAEREELHADARDFYDAAALRFGTDAAHGSLYVETPGVLLWRIAVQIRWSDPKTALELIDRALAEGITGAGADPERRVLVDRAKLLDELDRHPDAAEAYYAAGERYAVTGSGRALELFERAVHLAPNHPPFRWAFGESLRQHATAAEWRPDHDQLRQAKAQLEEGFRAAGSEPVDSWALASLALVDDALGVGEPALLFERALLRDPTYARGYAFLADWLRRRGYYREAVEAAAAAHDQDSADSYVVVTYAYSLLDVRDVARANKIVEEHRRFNELDLGVCVAQATVLLQLGKPLAAVELLESAKTDDLGVRFLQAICYAAAENYAAERSLYEKILSSADTSTHPGVTSWAAYRTGRIDEAVEGFRRVSGLAARHVTSNGMDLAQALLVRGSAHDVETGRALLSSSIAESMTIGDLVHLSACELPLLVEATRDAPHAAAVRNACEAAKGDCARRISTLLDLRRPPELPEVQLARARTAAARGDLREAVELYAPFAAAGRPPEVCDRLADVAGGLIAHCDALLASGDLPTARQVWERLLEAVPDDRTREGVRARLALSHFVAGEPLTRTAAGHLRRIDEDTLTELVETFAVDVNSLWAQIDGVRTVFAARPPAHSPAGHVSARRRLYANIYRLDRAAVPEPAMSPFVGAIEIALGEGLAHLKGAPEVGSLVGGLRDRLTREMGVWVPGIGVGVDESLSPRTVCFLVYGRVVATIALPADRPGDLTPLRNRLDDVLRDNLFRWISVDDIELWISGWDAAAGPDGGPDWLPPDPAGRFRLTRLLRMLLREGVTIRDRETIGRSFAAAGDQEDPYEMLTTVRRSLHPWTLGSGGEAAEPVALPADLEARIAAGLAADGSGWAMPRTDTRELVEALRAWRANELPPGSVPIRTTTPELRPYVWRLLAAERPRIFVVARKELP